MGGGFIGRTSGNAVVTTCGRTRQIGHGGMIQRRVVPVVFVMTGITRQIGRKMSNWIFTGGDNAVVAYLAQLVGLRMSKRLNQVAPDIIRVAGLAHIGCSRMRRRLAGRTGTVVTTGASAIHCIQRIGVNVGHLQPVRGVMTAFALV